MQFDQKPLTTTAIERIEFACSSISNLDRSFFAVSNDISAFYSHVESGP